MTAPRAARRRVVEAPRRKRPELRALRVIVEPDLDPDTSSLNGETVEAFEGGEIQIVGARAEADVEIEGTLQTLSSNGTWGIESDADEYLAEVYEHEWAQLRRVLTAVGVSTTELPVNVERDWIDWRT